ncbi:RNA polymerase sigma factor [Nocardiopsis potens]|uniref:RNA polymerase sigma factor n=1 Tax=Nocardiopsis potens TaxID=1246458 RepID=UPI000348A112|nr:RNA polymerase sigma factor [Nocardiopsis potens]
MQPPSRRALRAGDPAAFARLYDAHAPAVHRFAARLAGDRGTAEDVLQITFLEAWRLRERIRPEGPEGGGPEGDGPDGGDLLPWLLGIAVNVQRNAARGARRHRAALGRMPAPRAVPDFSDELVGRMDDADRLGAVSRAMGRLRRAEREVIALCVWSGLDYAAAAEALGVPVGTVRSRLSRARTRLRAEAERELREPARAAGQHQGGRGFASRSMQGGSR